MSPNSFDIVQEAEPLIMTSEPSSLQRAHRLLDRGFSVVPVPLPRPGVPAGMPGDGKVPALAWREYQTRRPTLRELEVWFSEPMNLAVVTGAISCVVVIDADSPDAVRWWTRRRPYTPWQTQTSRDRFHLWYRHPGIRVPNRARIDTRDGKLAIDVRGDGGYVIAPGSRHASGTEYLEAGNWNAPLERVPVFWPGWLARSERPKPPATRARPTGDLVERARRYLAAVPKPEIGCGSDVATLTAACRLVRGFGLSTAEAEELLWEWAGDRAGWTRAWIAQKVAHAERYGTEPLGALR